MAELAGYPNVIVPNYAVQQATSIEPTHNLWDKALQALDDEDKANIDFHNTNKLDILNDIFVAAEEKKRICLAKCWKYKKGDKEVIIRDQLEKIVGWVERFKRIGDLAVQYDPGHAALPWAGVRFFLQISVNDSQTFGAMAEGMEVISNLITRYTIFEKLYQRSSLGLRTDVAANEQLDEALCKLYITVLQYISKAKRYYAHSTAGRLIRAGINVESNVDRYIQNIAKAKEDVDECAQLMNTAHTHLINDEVQGLTVLLLQLGDPINRSATLLSDIHDSLKESERREMFRWLSKTQNAVHHKTMGKGFLLDSGRWLLQKKEFIEWREDSCSSILWLHGIPGSGKSKLVFSVIEYLNKEKSKYKTSAPLGYFYCARNTSEPERADPDEIMRSILKQLSSSKSSLSVREPVATKYKELKEEADENGCDEPPKLTVEECVELILDLLKSNPATIIIDALDECDPVRRHELLQALNKIIQDSSNVVNVFVSSRDDNDLVCRLEGCSNVAILVSDNSKDIKRFIASEVDQSIKEKRLLGGRVSKELKNQIIKVLTDGAQGMFRWVSLQIQNICNPQRMKHEEDVVAELGSLPKTLNESYEIIYQEIKNAGETSQQIADRAMKWLLCSKRRLEASELIAAVSINADGEYTPLTIRGLLDICCNLLVLDEELKTFRFAHLSVREYLQLNAKFNEVETNTLVLERCIDIYLSELNQQPERIVEQNDILREYAAFCWTLHCQNIGNNPGEKVKSKIKEFLFQSNYEIAPSLQSWISDVKGSYKSILDLDDPLRDLMSEIFTSPPPSPLMLACSFGLSWIVQDLIICNNSKEILCWNQTNDAGNSPLGLAAMHGHKEIVQQILELNDENNNNIAININFKDPSGQTPLSLAARHGHDAVVQLLLAHPDIAPDSKDTWGRTPLSWTAGYGHVAAAQLLLQHPDIDPDSKDDEGFTPLSWAAGKGYDAVVKILLLLECGDVDVNFRDGRGRTPLSWAAERGHEEVVRLILGRDDVDLGVEDKGGHTARWWAVRGGHEGVVGLLDERSG